MHLRRAVVVALILLGSLAAPTTADAQSRIVNGQAAGQGEYPAQGFLLFDTNPGPGQSLSQCGGTLVGSRQFLTAAHCSVDSADQPLPPGNFNVFLGEVDQNNFGDANRHFVAANAVHAGYNASSHRNDLAMLTLSQPVSFEPLRVVESDETSLWAPGVPARIIGWGTTCSTTCAASDVLLEANVPMVSDAACTSAYGSLFDATTMVCAADSQAPFHDTCQGDSGGPLMVPDGDVFALAGVVSWGIGCADGTHPGVYARIGQGALNTWVLDRTPRALFTMDHTPRAAEPATFNSTSMHPDGSAGFTQFRWDFDGDGQFDDGTGQSIAHTFPTAGTVAVGLEASKPGGYRAERYESVDVGAAPTPTPSPTATASPAPSGTPAPQAAAKPAIRLATLLIGRTATVDCLGRFGIRINFDALAPAGQNAVVTVRKGSAKIGSAKVKVARGKSVRAKVKLTKTGLRRLRKAKKLKVTVRLVLGSTVQTKTVILKTR